MAPSVLSNNQLLDPSIFYSSHLSKSTSDLHSALFPPRPYSGSQSLPPVQAVRRYRKNLHEMTGFMTTEDEFEALPIAVRRKYFSTLERLRFAQNSRSTALNNDIPIQSRRKSSLADRRGLSVPVLVPRRKQIDPSSRRSRKLSRPQSIISSNDASWFLSLPEKIQNKQFTREERGLLTGRLRDSVILDAADEAIFKAGRRASRNLTPIDCPPSSRSSMDSVQSSTMVDSMYETFRWMDEEPDLDLSLNLDDYHANLDGVFIPSPTSKRRPSFRRHMSISKMPFGRNSTSSVQPRSAPFEPVKDGHIRQKSRTMSLIAPKHSARDSVTSIDPNATHYQDPEARLKLRVYLASPQKFDEAIEFGFPSMDGVADGADKENKPTKRMSKDCAVKKSYAALTADKGQTFLNDDTASLFSDDFSMFDPDSPITPMYLDAGFRPQSRVSRTSESRARKPSADYSHIGATKSTLGKQQEPYIQAMAGSREMTLRMTLTRPDLRADETTIYGWQTARSPIRDDLVGLDDLEGPLGGLDGWGEKDTGVVKRLWNRVKSSQRKYS